MNILHKMQIKRIEKISEKYLKAYANNNAESLKTAQSALQALRAELAHKGNPSAVFPTALQKTIWDIDDTLIILDILLKANNENL